MGSGFIRPVSVRPRFTDGCWESDAGRWKLSTLGRNYGDVFTAEPAEDAEVFGQDRRDIVR